MIDRNGTQVREGDQVLVEVHGPGPMNYEKVRATVARLDGQYGLALSLNLDSEEIYDLMVRRGVDDPRGVAEAEFIYEGDPSGIEVLAHRANERRLPGGARARYIEGVWYVPAVHLNEALDALEQLTQDVTDATAGPSRLLKEHNR